MTAERQLPGPAVSDMLNDPIVGVPAERDGIARGLRHRRTVKRGDGAEIRGRRIVAWEE